MQTVGQERGKENDVFFQRPSPAIWHREVSWENRRKKEGEKSKCQKKKKEAYNEFARRVNTGSGKMDLQNISESEHVRHVLILGQNGAAKKLSAEKKMSRKEKKRKKKKKKDD